MIKSELIQRIATRNEHLYHRDVETIVSTILDEITAALARGDRVELRGFGAGKAAGSPHGTQPSDRRAGFRSTEERAFLQDRQGDARAPQRELQGLSQLDGRWRRAGLPALADRD